MTEIAILVTAALAAYLWTRRTPALQPAFARAHPSTQPPATVGSGTGDYRLYARLGGLFGRNNRNDDEAEAARQAWRLPAYEDDPPGQVRVLPPDEVTTPPPPAAPAGPEPVDPGTGSFPRFTVTPRPAPPVAPSARDLPPLREETEIRSAPYAPPPPAPFSFDNPAPMFDTPGIGDLLPVAESERLERWTELFRQQARYYAEATDLVQRETRTLQAYLQEQRVNMERMMAKLEDQLRPLKDYIATEQSNLDKLQQQMERQPSGLVASHFHEYIKVQQERIDRGKDEVATRYQPFQEYFAEQQNLVETLLSRFDDDFKKLSSTLAEQKRLIQKVSSGLSDGEYKTAMDFMTERQRAWADFARTTGEDPGVVYSRLAEISMAFAQGQRSKSGVLEHLFDLAGGADERLAEYVAPLEPVDFRRPVPQLALTTDEPAEPAPAPRRAPTRRQTF